MTQVVPLPAPEQRRTALCALLERRRRRVQQAEPMIAEGKLVRDAELASAPRNKYWQAYSMLIRCLYLPIGLVHVLLVVIVIATLCLSLFGIPWGLAMAKSLGACLNPVGIKCVSQAVAEAVQQRRMRMQVAQRLGSPQGQAV